MYLVVQTLEPFRKAFENTFIAAGGYKVSDSQPSCLVVFAGTASTGIPSFHHECE